MSSLKWTNSNLPDHAKAGSLESQTEPNTVSSALLTLMQRLESRLADMHELLICQRTVKDYYATAEVAQILGKAEFTVREWCRLGRVRAEKRSCGRGKFQEWMISHAELTRLRNQGLLPVGKR